MIVKNEEKVIKRLLQTLPKLVDWYTIVDTGSTDKTKEIIKETMDALGIPGEILDHKWVNFCTARNFALESIKGKAKWGFWIDADEQLIIDSTWTKESMIKQLDHQKPDICSCLVNYGSQQYFRSQLFRIDFPWIWKGAVHEVQVSTVKEKQPIGTQLNGLSTLVTPDGASWGDGSKEAQRKKYLEHAELLTEYIKTDNDVRWVFYLAQSYRDAFEWSKSEYWYNHRVQLGGGYWEEIYFSQLMVANMKRNQQKPISEVLEAFALCSKFDRGRCEHLIPSIRHYQQQQNWMQAYIISKYCYDNFKASPFPKSSLFIEQNVYDWVITDLHCISAFYMNKKQEAKSVYNKLRKKINEDKVPKDQHKRIIDNQKWYTN